MSAVSVDQELTHAAAGDIPLRYIRLRVWTRSADGGRAVVVLEIDRAPTPWLVAVACVLDTEQDWRPLAESGDGRLVSGAPPHAVEAHFGRLPEGGGAPATAVVAGATVPVILGDGCFLAVNWEAAGLMPPPPTDLPGPNTGGVVRDIDPSAGR